MLNEVVSTALEATPPTIFPDLNELLGGLMARVESILGDNFVGAYLTGSFALGAADLHSDCDFLVVTEDRVTNGQEGPLRELHDKIPTRPGRWTHNLEGSYAPRAELETLAALDKQWLYVDRGWREMQWSTHCNTEDVRWTLREHGITLVGPDPRELVGQVPADALRNRMRQSIENFLPDLFGWTSFEIAWVQRYAVTTLCRMLYTLETAEIASKPASLEWATHALASGWTELIQQVLDDRELGWDQDNPPRTGSVEATIAFAEYAKKWAVLSLP
jgi:Aminoglycoside adenylyltransferase, C-terminal domain/Nucleotidyltransferase domain